MRKAALVTGALLAASLGRAETDVRRAGDKVDLHATAAPLSEVLDRLSRQTGMKVLYDGPPPRGRVNIDLPGLTPAQAVFALLEGQGLNYAVRMDPSGTKVETLLLVAASGAAAPGTSPVLTPARPEPRRPEREPEPPEVEEETPAEAPTRERGERPDERVGPVMLPPPPPGTVLPLVLPTPPPPPAPPPPSPAPQD